MSDRRNDEFQFFLVWIHFDDKPRSALAISSIVWALQLLLLFVNFVEKTIHLTWPGLTDKSDQQFNK